MHTDVITEATSVNYIYMDVITERTNARFTENKDKTINKL